MNDRDNMMKYVTDEIVQCQGVKGIEVAMVSGNELVGLTCGGRLTAVVVSVAILDRYLALERARWLNNISCLKTCMCLRN